MMYDVYCVNRLSKVQELGLYDKMMSHTVSKFENDLTGKYNC